MSIGNSPEILSQGILVGTILVGGLGVWLATGLQESKPQPPSRSLRAWEGLKLLLVFVFVVYVIYVIAFLFYCLFRLLLFIIRFTFIFSGWA